MTEGKFDDKVLMRCTADQRQALDRIAKANDVDAPFLLRRATDAIVEYAERYGDKQVPLTMAVVQRIAPHNELAAPSQLRWPPPQNLKPGREARWAIGADTPDDYIQAEPNTHGVNESPGHDAVRGWMDQKAQEEAARKGPTPPQSPQPPHQSRPSAPEKRGKKRRGGGER
jgi:hypothetical protein